jgi:hypothetical protein
MYLKFKERAFTALVGLLLLGASAVAVVDKDQRGNFMELTQNVVLIYGRWVADNRQPAGKGGRRR